MIWSRCNRDARLLLLTTLAVSMIGCANESKDKSMDQRVDALMGSYMGDVPGASVLVTQHGEPILHKSYGYARRIPSGDAAQPSSAGPTVATTTATNYRLASVTKQFTATAIMMLIDRGELSCDTRLTDIFDGFPAYGADITVSQLLSHTSGLIDYEGLIPDTTTIQVTDADVLKMMMAQVATKFAPGSEYSYSNSAYALLAMTVEELSGQTFAAFLKDNIFEPLGMTNTVAYQAGISDVSNRAYGHVFDDAAGAWTERDQSITSAVLGDGGVYSSTEDLLKWERALRDRRLLPDSLWALAWTAKPNTRHGDDLGDDTDRPAGEENTSENTEHYGYGVYIRSYRGHDVLRHSGSTMGFRNDMERFPELGLSVYVLTNRNSPAVIDLTRSIADVYLDELTIPGRSAKTDD